MEGSIRHAGFPGQAAENKGGMNSHCKIGNKPNLLCISIKIA